MPVVLDLPCPRCQRRPVNTAMEVQTCHGFLFSINSQTKVEVACLACARKHAVLDTLRMLVVAPLSILTWAIAPVLAVINLVEVFGGGRPERLEAVLKQAGIDPLDVTLDAEGFTRERRAGLDACIFVVTEAVWADGHLDQRELDEAVRVVCTAFEGSVHPHEVECRVRYRKSPELRPDQLRLEYRVEMLRVACHITKADGRLASEELRFLRRLADILEISDEVLVSILGVEPRRERSRHRASAGGGTTPLQRAASILGVDLDAPLVAIKRAYRSLSMVYHPDRQGGDAASAKAAHDKMAEINWAYQVFTMRGEP